MSKLKTGLKALAYSALLIPMGIGGYILYEQNQKLDSQEEQIVELKTESEKNEDQVEALEEKINENEIVMLDALVDQKMSLEELLGIDGKYDTNNTLAAGTKGLNRIKKSVCRITTIATYTNNLTNKSETRTTIGTGTAILGNYILTANHVVNPPAQINRLTMTNKGLRQVKYTLTQVAITVLGHDKKEHHSGGLIYEDKETDSAVISLPKSAKIPNFPYAIGNSQELKTGHFVYALGHAANSGLNTREGIVSKEEGGIDIIEPVNTFMTSAGINPGDSGGPIIAIRDGQYELVGISHAKIIGRFGKIERMGEAIGITQMINKFIKEYEANPMHQLYEGLKEE